MFSSHTHFIHMGALRAESRFWGHPMIQATRKTYFQYALSIQIWTSGGTPARIHGILSDQVLWDHQCQVLPPLPTSNKVGSKDG